MTQPPVAAVRVSRRKFLAGTAAGAALLSAGGASALILHERGGNPRSAAGGSLDPNVFQPAAAGPNPLDDASARLRHLLRRTTFAATKADVGRYTNAPLASVVDDLLDQPSLDDSAADKAVAAYNFDTTKAADVVATWIARLMVTQRPMLERMTLFWHGLLTSGLSKTGGKRADLLLTQNQLFRDHAFEPFGVLLKNVVRDPAMMLWLDIQTSKKGHPNENYARELMELFTLGAGNYSETDVRESARAHTGYGLDANRSFVFRPNQHDDGPKTFLGQTGNFDAGAIVDIVLKQDAAPAHFARRLFEFFAYPDPADGVIAPIAAVARDSNFDTKRVVRAVLTSEAFYSPQAYRAIVKSPVDYTIGAVRLTGSKPGPRVLAQAMRSMGQVLFNPPNVAGWPGGQTWLGTSTWFARVNFAAQLINSGASAGGVSMLPATPRTADEAIDASAGAMLDSGVSDAARLTLREYLDDGGGFAALPPKTQTERLRGLVALLLASPEYQLL